MKIFVIIISYLLGAIPFGYILGKMKGIDVRKYGSGNIGTSNVARTLGKKAAILTLLGDGLKGLIAVLLARIVFHGSLLWIVAAGIAVVVGHCWTVFLKFKGGKGVTTTYGAFLGIAWPPALAVILTWVLVTLISKKSSVAALISAPCAPIFAYLSGFLLSGDPLPGTLFAAVSFVIIYIRHIENIKRILAGREHRLDEKIRTQKDKS
jgi:glycerol-3-phosphate acyltransferase PlsY